MFLFCFCLFLMIGSEEMSIFAASRDVISTEEENIKQEIISGIKF